MTDDERKRLVGLRKQWQWADGTVDPSGELDQYRLDQHVSQLFAYEGHFRTEVRLLDADGDTRIFYRPEAQPDAEAFDTAAYFTATEKGDGATAPPPQVWWPFDGWVQRVTVTTNEYDQNGYHVKTTVEEAAR